MYQCLGRRRALSEAKGERVRDEKSMYEQINESSNKLILKLLQVDNKTNYSSDNWGQRRWNIGRFLFLERASRSMSGEVSKKCLECVYLCKVSHPKGAQNGPQFACRLQGICKEHVDDLLATVRHFRLKMLISVCKFIESCSYFLLRATSPADVRKTSQK